PSAITTVEKLADLAGKLIDIERLRDQVDVRVKPTVLHNGVAGVTGREQDWQSRTKLQEPVGKLPPIHAVGQNNIREQQIEAHLRFFCKEPKGFWPRPGLSDEISQVKQSTDAVAPYISVVFHHQDRFAWPGPR